MKFRCLVSAVSVFALMAANAVAQENATEDEDRVLNAVEVRSTRLRGTAITDIEPEQVLTSADIEAYGVSSIEELIAELGPELSSTRGRGAGGHIFLVNGVRVASFREISAFPPEAVERMDVLPEEAALQYGYGANQRVINIILKTDFSAWTFSGEIGGPVEGAGRHWEVDGNFLGIGEEGRSSIDGEIELTDPILESDRGLGSLLQGENSLSNDIQTISIAGSTHRSVFETTGMTLSGNIDVTDSDELLGYSEQTFTLPGASPFSTTGVDADFVRYIGIPGVLTQNSETVDANLNLTFTRDVGDWFVTSTTSIGRNNTVTQTDLPPDASAYQSALTALDPTASPSADLTGYLTRSRERTERTADTISTNLLANGELWEITGGWVGAGLSLDLAHASRESETNLNGTTTTSSLDRQTAKIQGSFDFPLIVDDMDIPLIDRLIANATVNATNYSDFGTLYGFDGTLSWTPAEPVRLIASYTLEEGAPTMSQLGDTVSVTPNVEIFDFVQGQSVLATRISGGNSALIADTRHVWKLSAEWSPLEETDLDFRFTYTDSQIDDPIGAFPNVDAAIEAAFPTRFVRDAGGDLISMDLRPVNYAEETRRDFSWSVSWRGEFAQPETPAGPGAGMRPGMAGGRPGAGSPPSGAPNAAPSGDAPNGARPTPESEGASSQQGAPGAGGPPPAASGTRPSGAPPSGATHRGPPPGAAPGGGPPRGGMMMGRRGPPQGGRIFVSLNHNIRLEHERLLADGYPVQDFLNGAAFGRGGQPEHEVMLNAGVFYKGYGVRFSTTWESATDVDTGSSQLHFSDQTSVNLRFFHNVMPTSFLGQQFEWLQGTRMSLEIDNLLDDVVTVTDATGVIPLRYEGDRLDPQGLNMTFSIRRQF